MVNVSGEPPKPPKTAEEWKEAIAPDKSKGPLKPKRKDFVDADPMAPGRKLRTIREDFPPIHDPRITLILFGELWAPRFATTRGAKLQLLDALPEDPKASLVAVWTGAKESHAFDVTDEIASRWVAMLTPEN